MSDILNIQIPKTLAPNLRATFELAVAHGAPGTDYPHLRAAAAVWPLLVALEQSEAAAATGPSMTEEPPPAAPPAPSAGE